MKKIIGISKTLMVALSLGLAVGLPLIAAETGQINYQARLLDSYGRRLNTAVNLSFEIYDAATNGNLLWSETQTNVVVQDGVYSVVLGSQTPIPASVFSQNAVYLELGINGEIMTPRPQILATAYALVARTVMGSNIFENQTSGYLGVGTTNPAAKLDVSGTLKATGFKMPSGATANYVLVSDADGVGTWQPYSAVVTENDPIHTNWVLVVYTPATNSIWGAIGAEATTRGNADIVLQDNIDTSSNALNTAIGAEATTRGNADTVLQNNIGISSNSLNTAVGLRLLRAGDTMTGPLTNLVGFVGNGAGLTNIQSSGVILTGYVQRAGDTMTGPLVISNNLTVALTNQAGTTNFISLGGVAISNWNQVSGGDLTNDLVNLRGATNVLNTRVNTDLAGATNALSNATNALNTRVNTDLANATNNLYNATNALNTRVGTAETDITALKGSTNALNTRAGNLEGATNALNTTRVLRAGDTMTGALVISNNLTVSSNVTVSGTNQVNILYVTNAIILQNAAAITNWLGLTNDAMLGAIYARRDVGVTNIAANAVTNVHIADAAVTTAKIADAAVTGPKIAGGWTGVVTNRSTLITNVMYFYYGICTNTVVNP